MINYFDTIYGNNDSIRYFTCAIKENKLAHAYILEGPAGSGKRTFAKAIAATREKDSQFADKILSENSPDLMFFGLAEKKKTIGVDTIRTLKNAVYIKPSELDAKFFILTDCQAMTTAAQNAALKILEDPPQNVYFFLCTDSSSALLPTVRSRAQTIRMQIFGENELGLYAKKDPKWQSLSQRDPEGFMRTIKKANGCIGNLYNNTDDKDELRMQENALKLISLLDSGEYVPLLLYCTKIASSRSELDYLLLKTALGLRDILACRHGNPIDMQLYLSESAALNAAFHLTTYAILSVITEIEQTRLQLTGNPNLKGAQILLADKLFRAIQN
ncbi:MAG: hypothetical protein E7616_02140 [Ruminococcaceae bacterium]|nr:hypothetical protein [Oscillospiraceae bacterium]